MTEPRAIKVDASAKCEICGGEPFAMVRRPQLMMDKTRKSNKPAPSSLLCEEHFQQFKKDNVSLGSIKQNSNLVYAVIGLAVIFCLSFYLLRNN